jgi:hypothetical protein
MSRAKSIHPLLRHLPLVLALLLATGCRGPWSKNWKYSDMASPTKMVAWAEIEDEPVVPRRFACSWTDTVLHQTEKNPQRGFGGRLVFYGEEPDKPVLVDGQLVVYAFDETDRQATDNKPTRRYVFPPDQVSRRMSKTALGPSYSFWLPWDEVGGRQTEISLIARFEPVGGAIVVGEQTKHLLPGEMGSPIGVGASAVSTAAKLPEGIPMKPATPTLEELKAQIDKLNAANQAQQANQVQQASYESPVAASQTSTTSGAMDEPSQPTLSPTQVQGEAQAAAANGRRMTTTSISLPDNYRVRPGNSSSTMNERISPRGINPPAGSVQAGNVLAEPQSPPPNTRGVAAPISYPAVQNVQGVAIPAQPAQPRYGQLPMGQQLQSAHPGFMTPQQSPLGNGFVAPLQPAVLGTQQQVPHSVGQLGVPPTAPIMAGQPPLTTASGWATVTYPPAR